MFNELIFDPKSLHLTSPLSWISHTNSAINLISSNQALFAWHPSSFDPGWPNFFQVEMSTKLMSDPVSICSFDCSSFLLLRRILTDAYFRRSVWLTQLTFKRIDLFLGVNFLRLWCCLLPSTLSSFWLRVLEKQLQYPSLWPIYLHCWHLCSRNGQSREKCISPKLQQEDFGWLLYWWLLCWWLICWCLDFAPDGMNFSFLTALTDVTGVDAFWIRAVSFLRFIYFWTPDSSFVKSKLPSSSNDESSFVRMSASADECKPVTNTKHLNWFGVSTLNLNNLLTHAA